MVKVRSYMKRKGTVVNQHYRRAPISTKMPKSKKDEPIIVWDTYDLWKERVDQNISEGMNQEEAEEEANTEGDYSDEWDMMNDYLSEILADKTKGLKNQTLWYVEVKNFGWRGSDGRAVVEADNGEQFLQGILPRTENTFRIFNDGKRGLKIQNFHHDSPTGREWYYARPMTAKEAYAYNMNGIYPGG